MTIPQKNRKGLLNLMAIVLIFSLLVSCSSELENAIVDRWSEIGGTETFEFFKDGKVNLIDQGMTIGGTYKFIEKDKINLELGGFGALIGPIVAKVSIIGDELTFTLVYGDELKYKRVE